MKRFYLILSLSFIFGIQGCVDDNDTLPVPAWVRTAPQARCGYVNDKFTANPPSDTTAANRTYWLRWSADTTCLPTNPQCGRQYDIQVPKAVYDTMLVRRYPDRYCL